MKHADLAVAIGVVMVVVMMVLPLPPVLLDLLITLNIAIALTIVLLSLYTQDALEFSVFPSLLLITTLFRLAINISVTRLILLHGDAGSVIEAFGKFVVGGNVVVGLVVFLILVVIQFVVITNGAGRVAEVAARFTLDAMPGKQMAIDADLNAGQITDDEAREPPRQDPARGRLLRRDGRRLEVRQGRRRSPASSSSRSTCSAASSIGMLQQGMGFGDALSTFSLLSIGDGLVAQIPALLISTATGIIVTRAATDTDTNLGADVAGQITAQPAAAVHRGRRARRLRPRAGPAEAPVPAALGDPRRARVRHPQPPARTRPPTWSRWRRPRRRGRCRRRRTPSPSRSPSTRSSWRSATA